MNFGGDLEVVLVKKRGVKNHNFIFMRADRFDDRAEEGIEDKNGAEEGIEKSLNFSCPNFKKKTFRIQKGIVISSRAIQEIYRNAAVCY